MHVGASGRLTEHGRTDHMRSRFEQTAWTYSSHRKLSTVNSNACADSTVVINGRRGSEIDQEGPPHRRGLRECTIGPYRIEKQRGESMAVLWHAVFTTIHIADSADLVSDPEFVLSQACVLDRVPAFAGPNGMPVGLSLITRRFCNQLLLSIGSQ